MSLSPTQIEQRLDGITATDIAAILGYHPYRSPVDVFLDKTGQAPPFAGNERTKWGHLLEPVIRSDYEERHGVRVELCGTLEHPERTWMKATPDGIVYKPNETAPDRGLEIKTHTVRVAGEYGAPGSDEVPAYELAQCMWNIAASGLRRWDLVAFIDGQPIEYVIDRDDELIGIMVERGERFLVDNVRAGVAPEPDGSESFESYLRKRWTQNNGDTIKLTGATDDEQQVYTWIEEGKALREQLADAEAKLGIIEQRIKERIGDRDGIEWKSAVGKPLKLTWKHSKPQKWIDHAAILMEMRSTLAIVAQAKTVDVKRALATLSEVTEYLGRSSATYAKLTGRELSELIGTLHGALVEAVKPSDSDKHSKPFTNRPFNWPRSWRGPSSK